MIITIHQPEHLPWLGFFNKLAKAELFVILDSVQFEKNYFQNRNRILGSNGVQWIGIPAVNQGHMEKTIATTEIASVTNPKWKEKYLNTIAQSYRKYPFFADVYPVIEQAITLDTPYLADVNISMIRAFSEKLGFAPEFIRSSELGVEGLKSDLILDICKTVHASTYIAGPSGRDYLNMASFAEAGIEVVFNDFHHPAYPQRRTQEFVSHLSAVDLFMNCGYEESGQILMEGNEETSPF